MSTKMRLIPRCPAPGSVSCAPTIRYSRRRAGSPARTEAAMAKLVASEAGGRVVDRSMPVVRRVAQIVHADVDQPGGAGLAEQRHVEHPEEGGEDRDDVEAHALQSRQRG